MLNSEMMRKDEGLAAAQQWVRRVIQENPARYVVVMEHYQWFFATTGRTSQYERWHDLFDECGVDLAIAGNNHIYARTNALYEGKPFVSRKNPERKIYHTVLVERNGFIQSVFSGTPFEERGPTRCCAAA